MSASSNHHDYTGLASNPEAVSEFISHLRRHHGLSMKTLASKFGVCPVTVHRWETRQHNPNSTAWTVIAQAMARYQWRSTRHNLAPAPSPSVLTAEPDLSQHGHLSHDDLQELIAQSLGAIFVSRRIPFFRGEPEKSKTAQSITARLLEEPAFQVDFIFPASKLQLGSVPADNPVRHSFIRFKQGLYFQHPELPALYRYGLWSRMEKALKEMRGRAAEFGIMTNREECLDYEVPVIPMH